MADLPGCMKAGEEIWNRKFTIGLHSNDQMCEQYLLDMLLLLVQGLESDLKPDEKRERNSAVAGFVVAANRTLQGLPISI